MSNNIYDILGKIGSVLGVSKPVEETTKAPVYESVEAKGDIMEAVKSLEEKYMGFKAVEKAAKEGGAKDPAAVAASIGRKKYGKKKFQKAAAAGKKLGEEQVEESGGPYELYNPKHPKFAANYKKFKAKNPDAKLEDFIAAMKKKEHGVSESHEELTDLDAYQFAEPDSDANIKPAKSKAEQAEIRRRIQDLADKAREKDDWFDGTNKETNVRVHHAQYKDEPEDDLDEMTSSTGGEVTKKGNVTTHKGKKYGGEEEHHIGDMRHTADRKTPGRVIDVGDDEDLDEVAPPGAKAERMVKHIKKGYAKDGKLTNKEKAIAYATTWAAHKKGQVEEGVKFSDTIKNSEAKMTKAKAVKLKESRMIQEGDYYYESIGKALAEKNPNLDTASNDFYTAVRQEMVAQGMKPNQARNILAIDEDFIMDVATSYGHYVKELAECSSPINSQLGGVEELDEIARLAGLPSQEEWKASRNAPETPAAPAVKPGASTFDKSKLNPMREDDYEEVNVEESPDTMDLEEQEMGEGNEFSGALAAAKASGAKEFEVDGKKYTVKEDVNLNVTANGEDVVGLIRKLAGMGDVEAEQGVEVVALPQDAETAIAQGIVEPVEVEVDEERDVEHLNTPREQTAGISASIPSGTDLNRSKKQDPATANKAANPLAVKEDELWKSYESMIGEIKQ